MHQTRLVVRPRSLTHSCSSTMGKGFWKEHEDFWGLCCDKLWSTAGNLLEGEKKTCMEGGSVFFQSTWVHSALAPLVPIILIGWAGFSCWWMGTSFHQAGGKARCDTWQVQYLLVCLVVWPCAGALPDQVASIQVIEFKSVHSGSKKHEWFTCPVD